jgi:hypothetical protein
LRLLLFVHCADKADSFAGKGLDEALLVAAVADCDPQCINARAEGRFRNDASVPDRCDQIVLADDAFAVADEVFQEVEDLGLDRDKAARAPQLTPVAIENKVLESVGQIPLPGPSLVTRQRA